LWLYASSSPGANDGREAQLSLPSRAIISAWRGVLKSLGSKGKDRWASFTRKKFELIEEATLCWPASIIEAETSEFVMVRTGIRFC
jgi:hypothetical protein